MQSSELQELEDGIRHVRVICGGEKEEEDSSVFRPKIVCAQKMIRLMAKDEKQTISYRVGWIRSAYSLSH